MMTRHHIFYYIVIIIYTKKGDHADGDQQKVYNVVMHVNTNQHTARLRIHTVALWPHALRVPSTGGPHNIQAEIDSRAHGRVRIDVTTSALAQLDSIFEIITFSLVRPENGSNQGSSVNSVRWRRVYYPFGFILCRRSYLYERTSESSTER